MTNPRTAHTFRTLRRTRRRLVVLAPHPDDETLGCGLLLAAAARAGVRLAVVALTDGQASHPASRRWPPALLGRLRRGELRRALARLGAAGAAVRPMGWRDGRLDADGSARRLRGVLRALRAGVVLAASPADHHPDHRAAWRLAAAAVAGTRLALVGYAVWSRLDAPPRRRARGPGLAAKHWAMAAHRSQRGPYIADDPGGFTFEPAALGRLLREPESLTRSPLSQRRAPRTVAPDLGE